MNWFYIALLAPALWGINNHIDKYLISRYFKSGGIGALAIFSSLIGIAVLPFIYIFFPHVLIIPLAFAGLIIVSGIIGILGMLPYFYALERDEASIVVPLYQTVPIFSFILAYFLLGETLQLPQVLAALLIMAGAIGLSLDLSEHKPTLKTDVFWLMMLSSLMVAISSLVFKYVAINTDFWTTAFWQYIGFILTGFILLLTPVYRQQFQNVILANKIPVISLNIINEVVNIIGSLVMSFATLLAPLALVWVVNGFQPFFVLLYGILLTVFFPQVSQESLLKKHLAQKIFFILIMFGGTYMLR